MSRRSPSAGGLCRRRCSALGQGKRQGAIVWVGRGTGWRVVGDGGSEAGKRRREGPAPHRRPPSPSQLLTCQVFIGAVDVLAADAAKGLGRVCAGFVLGCGRLHGRRLGLGALPHGFRGAYGQGGAGQEPQRGASSVTRPSVRARIPAWTEGNNERRKLGARGTAWRFVRFQMRPPGWRWRTVAAPCAHCSGGPHWCLPPPELLASRVLQRVITCANPSRASGQ